MPTPPELIALATGAVLVVVAGAWWLAARRSADDAIAAELQDPDPDTRRAAIAAAARDGLASHAAELLELAEREPEESVRRTLAEVVARNQWEPVREPRVAELRRWAHRRLERSHATTILVTGVGGAAGVAVVNALRARGLRV